MSVVVPACGRTEALRRCLAALAAQQLDGGLEVIVSVDGSEPSPAAVRDVAPEGLDLQVIQSGQTGPAGARNRGAAAATRPLLAFVDDDCEPADGWAAALAAALERDPDALVGGPLLNPYSRDSSAAASHAITEALYECSTFDFLPSANLALLRDRFEALGGFDESFPTAAAEDREFCARALGRGMRVVPVDDDDRAAPSLLEPGPALAPVRRVRPRGPPARPPSREHRTTAGARRARLSGGARPLYAAGRPPGAVAGGGAARGTDAGRNRLGLRDLPPLNA